MVLRFGVLGRCYETKAPNGVNSVNAVNGSSRGSQARFLAYRMRGIQLSTWQRYTWYWRL